MHRIRRQLMLSLVVALAFVACGGSDDASIGDADPGGDPAATADGGGGGGDVEATSLGDFPIPGPGVGEAALIADADGAKAYLVTFPADAFDAVQAFYDEWTASQPDTYQRIDAESGGVSWILTSSSDRVRIIVLSPAIEGDSIASVSLTDGPAG